MYSGMAKGFEQQQKIKPVALAIVKLH